MLVLQVGAHQTQLLNNPQSGYNTLLARFDASNEFSQADLEDLKRVFTLFQRLEETEDSGLIPVSNQTRDHIVAVGTNKIHECVAAPTSVRTEFHYFRCECKLKLNEQGELQWDKKGRPEIEDNLDELIAKLANRYQLYENLMDKV